MLAMPLGSLGCIDDSLNDTKGYSGANDAQGVPEAAHKYQSGHFPGPFEAERKHLYSSLNG
jgi:hypothetical protein